MTICSSRTYGAIGTVILRSLRAMRTIERVMSTSIRSAKRRTKGSRGARITPPFNIAGREPTSKRPSKTTLTAAIARSITIPSMRRLIAVFRAAAAKFSHDGCAFLAQAIAFNALFAIFPILVLVVSTLSFIYGSEEAQQRALALAASIAPNVQATLTENVRQVNHLRGISGVVALITLVWSGKNLFMALAYALDQALNIPKGRPLHLNIAVALLLLPMVGFLMIVATTLPVVISFIIRY